MLSLKKSKILYAWKDCWKNNYLKFYQNYYNNEINENMDKIEQVDIFRYTLNTICTIANIPYLTLKNFLLISTLEGLLFVKSIMNKLTNQGSNKTDTIANVFINVSKDQNKKWRFLVDDKHFKSSKFDQKGHDQDLKDFLKSAYKYRNNIAHPEEKRKIEYKPAHLYIKEPSSRYEYLLSAYISDWYKKFLRFILNIWVNSNFKNKKKWYQYLESLFP